jgi:hypothetical protein
LRQMTRRSSQPLVGAVLRLVSALVALALVVTVAAAAAHDGAGPATVIAAEVVDEGEPAIEIPEPAATAVPRARTAPGWARVLELTPLAAAPPPVPPPQA